MIKKLIISFYLIILGIPVFSQGEANNWIFPQKAGMEFTNGGPEDLNYSTPLINNPTTVVSDSAGNLLFYSDGFRVYNRNFQVMDNGNDILSGRSATSCIAFAKPGSSRYYYLFTVGEPPDSPPPSNHGGRYSIIDMQANSGLGKVTVKNTMLDQGENAMIKLTATFHKNNKDIWLLTENQDIRSLYIKSYLVKNNGIFLKSTYRQQKKGNGYIGTNGSSQLRVSPDSKKIINVCDQFAPLQGFMYTFDNESGLVSYLFGITPIGFYSWGAEFSPSSEFVYIGGPSVKHVLYQFDATKNDSISFNQSATLVGSYLRYVGGNFGMMQCAPDGKIYGARLGYDTLFAINKPDLNGLDCDVNPCAYKTNGKMDLALPQFLTSYAQRFYFTGTCANESFQFTSHFFPEPASLLWDFGDGNTSTELNPVHQYAEGGEYTVHVSVVFPNASTGEATRKVKVAGLPQTTLPTELTVCKGQQVNLDAGLFSSWHWNTGDTVQSIPVADTGYYWVEVKNDTGCIARDSVHVQWYPVPQLTSDTVISPTTCGNNIGAITGVNIIGGTPPYSIEWLNSLGNIVGTTNDLYSLGVDNYYLWVTDGNSCRNLVASCAIQNFDKNYIIKNVTPDSTWCNQPKGNLEVEVQGGLSDRLLYTIDNWVTHQTTGVFTDLMPNQPYYVKVKDSLNCEAVYAGNPVIISSKPGVEITGHNELPEIDNLSNGSITIFAIGDSVTYSLNGQVPAQTSNVFENLVQGQYTIDVRDKHGCDSTLYITILPQTGQTLFATAGDTMVCNGLRASEPLMVSNFKDITSFEITLSYNNLLVNATGVINVHNEIASGLEPVNYPSAGMVKLKWTCTNALTLPDNTVLFYLAMQAKNPGISTVNWTLANNETNFVNKFGVVVPVKDSMGKVTIAPNPQIWGFYQKNVCELSPMSQMALASGGTGSLDVLWETPKGIRHGMECKVDTAKLNDSGWYHVTVIDKMNCIARDSVQVKVVPLPVANLPSEGDTLLYTPPYQLTATSGYYMYLWNTGENTNFINVTEDGKYTVIINTEEGCTDTSSVVMMNGTVEIKVPNAFTPNGDGLNDTFKPVVNSELVRQFSMSIYNKWGEKIFETSDATEGWDGENAIPGVYVWVISYANRVGKSQQIKGIVSLLR